MKELITEYTYENLENENAKVNMMNQVYSQHW